VIVSTPGDEGRHPPGPGEYFNESWYFDFSRDDGTGGYVRLGLYPNQRTAWYWAYVVSPEHGLVVVRDHDVPLPRGDALEVRADGLWAETVCETPMEHWGLGLEAFGVRLDEPGDAYRLDQFGGEIGERVAVGLDLEWEGYTPVYDYPYEDHNAEEGGIGAHYQHAGTVHGDILIGQDRIPFEGRGERDHSWGQRDWWVWGWHWTSFQIGDRLAINFVQPDELELAIGYIWRAGDELEPVTSIRNETHFGADEIPTAARYVINHELEVDVEIVAAAPVPLIAPDGRTARFPRALCRYTTSEGTGTGWGEWLQVGRPVSE
jgi:hypothetical protein